MARERRNVTRRRALTYGTTVVGGSLLAGCLGGEEGNGEDGENGTESGNETEATETETRTETAENDTDSGNETETGSDGSENADAGNESEAEDESNGGNETDGSSGPYTSSLAPVGEVTLEAIPEDVMVYSLLYADMAVAYGHGDAVNSLGFDAETGGGTLDAYYDHLEGVSFDREDLTQLNTGSGAISVDQELFYELDSDLHLADPALIASFEGWDRETVEEIAENVAPWFGNAYSRAHGEPPESYADDYEYYTLWEIAERVAALFGAGERYGELSAVHDDLVATIEEGLPPEEERPTVGAIIFMEETFYPSALDAPGFATSDLRPLGATDAFAGEELTYETSYDYEAMLEFDPDVLLHRYGVASYYDVGAIAETLADHPVASRITAVENGRVYPSGDPEQGPLMNLFQLEMAAKQLYPDQFGAWPEDNHGEAYPEFPEEERLFDRERVADAIGGAGQE
ncbi:ABC transporter substrate-binding protein [Saliphagus sp. LR7]|uniref:ABC transporter substrate-binding protein n=1 Tax=Saliphagus sp. LR7 TaxID=2282654 RepID=UPI0018E4DC6F|nr:ABC transporter substrate-binding protein [Saliphagus sp. LR7]